MSFEWISETPGRRRAISSWQRRAVVERDKGRCRYCGCIVCDPLDLDAVRAPKFHIDHVLPAASGGATHLENLVLACCACNLTKGGAVWRPLPVGATGPVAPRARPGPTFPHLATLALDDRRYQCLMQLAAAHNCAATVLLRVLIDDAEAHPDQLDRLRSQIAAETAAVRRRKN